MEAENEMNCELLNQEEENALRVQLAAAFGRDPQRGRHCLSLIFR